MKLPIALPLIAIVVLFGAQATAVAQLIQNPDFTSNAGSFYKEGYLNSFDGTHTNPGSITDWMNASQGVGLDGNGIGGPGHDFAPHDYETNITNDPSSEPAVYAFVQGDQNIDGLSQGLTLTANTSYVLTFLGGVRSGDTAAEGEVSIVAPGLSKATDFGYSSDFATETLDFTTGSDVTGATLYLSNTSAADAGDNTVDFTHFELTATGTTPEPSTYALLGLGALALLLVSRRVSSKA